VRTTRQSGVRVYPMTKNALCPYCGHAFSIETFAERTPCPACEKTIVFRLGDTPADGNAAISGGPAGRAKESARRSTSDPDIPLYRRNRGVRKSRGSNSGWLRDAHSLGISSLILGILAFVFCWVPHLGALTLPVSFVGMGLGGTGVWMAWRRRGAGIGFPIAGAGCSFIAFVVAGIWTSMDVADTLRRQATNQVPVALTSGMQALPEKSDWAAADCFAVRQNDIEVRIADLEMPNDQQLTIRIRVDNAGTSRTVEYRSWSSAAGPDAPRLSDSFGNSYRKLQETGGSTTLYPGKYATEDLAFQAPIDNIDYLHLELPASAFGGNGQLRLEIPQAMLLMKAAQSLGAAGVPKLCKLLSHPNAATRARAAKVLSIFHEDVVGCLDILRQALYDSSPEVRTAVCQAIASAGPKASLAVTDLAAGLKDPQPEVRAAAAAALGQIGVPARSQLPPLAECLVDESQAVQSATRQALAELGPLDQRDVAALSQLVQHVQAPVRLYALKALGRIGPRGRNAIGSVLPSLDDADAAIAHEAAITLQKIGPPTPAELDAILPALEDRRVSIKRYAALESGALAPHAKNAVWPKLVNALTDSDAEVRQGAFTSLGKSWPLGGDDVTVLRDLLRAHSSEARKYAAMALGQVAGYAKRAVPALEEALDDSDPAVRRYAAETLGKVGADARSALTKLGGLLENADPEVRAAAAEALSLLVVPDDREASRDVIPRLGKALRDPDVDSRRGIREKAARALARIGSPAAKVLGEALSDSRKEVRRTAVFALEQLGKNCGPALGHLQKSLGDPEAPVRAHAATALGKLGPVAQAAVPALKSLVNDPDAEVARSATEAIDRIDPGPGAVDALLQALGRDEPEASQKAREALANKKAMLSKAVPALVAALGSTKESVRSFAMEAIGQTGAAGASAIPKLIDSLKDSSPDMRESAVKALGNIGERPSQVIPALVPMLRSSQPTSVRLEAAAALGAFGKRAAGAVSELIQTLSDSDQELRARACTSLAQIGPAAIPDLIESATHSIKSTVRLGAVRALGEMGPAATDALSALARISDSDRSAEVQQAAREARKLIEKM
jgi:HEAT repeat protein